MQPEKNTIVAIHLMNDFSGSPLVFSQSLQGLRKAGHEVVIHTSSSREGFLDRVGARKVNIPYRFYEGRIMRLLAFMFSQAILFFQMFRYLRKDVTFYVNTLLPFGAALAGKLMGKKVVYHIHESYIRPAILKRWLRTVAAYSADTVLYVSNYLLESEKIPGVKGQVVYNALPDEFVEGASHHRYHARGPGSFTVLMVCSMKDYKGIPEFVAMAGRHPALRFELVLSAAKEEIASYFGSASLPSNLEVFPVQKNLSSFYSRASLVVNLTNPALCIETFGMTLLEAMCYGIPVIAPPVGGPAEIVRNGINGLLIDARHDERIDEELRRLAESPDLMERMSQQAKETAGAFRSDKLQKQVIRSISGMN